MKRFLLSSIIFVFLFQLYAREEILIDFSNLKDTTVDFTKDVVNGWGLELGADKMSMSLRPDLWNAKVRKSSRLKAAIEKTYVLDVTKSINYPDQSVLGVRAYFPERTSHADVEIFPPFEIPSYYEDPANPDGMGTFFLNKGVVRNVGIIRKLSIRVLGNNFNYGLYVRIKDNKNIERDVYMGHLNFLGWRTLTWVNPNYEQEKKYRDKARSVLPYYPNEYPYVKIIGLIIQKDMKEKEGNFTVMFKEVTLDFDEHFLQLDNYEHLQEDIYGIYREELITYAKKLMERINHQVYLTYRENERMHRD